MTDVFSAITGKNTRGIIAAVRYEIANQCERRGIEKYDRWDCGVRVWDEYAEGGRERIASGYDGLHIFTLRSSESAAKRAGYGILFFKAFKQ